MGLSDRDYMRERIPASSGRKESGQNLALRTTLLMTLIGVSVLFLLYKGSRWWDSSHRDIPPGLRINPGLGITPPSSRPARTAPPTASTETGTRQESRARGSVQPSTKQMAITKCVIDGQVSFTDGICPSGATSSGVTVNATNFGTVQRLKFEPTSQPLQGRESPIQQPMAQAPNVGSNNEAECKFLDQRIRSLDALALQPQSAQTQDAIAAERKKHRARQFALKC